ncbi:endo-arabinase [Flavobacterium sp. WC2429]|uniref:Endo-arabinase n=2 Tax=unclassified Flavobacterium TaxID=196869 RepID=A0AB39WE71_9FLAO
MNWKISICLLISLFAMESKAQNSEQENIKKLLEKESATYRSGDSKAHASCWHIQPYSRILVSTTDGNTYDIPPAEMVKISEDNTPRGGSSINTNYKISINGKTAWVSHNEESTAKDGTISYSYEIRLLEKIKKEWKLVGQSIHMYKKK